MRAAIRVLQVISVFLFAIASLCACSQSPAPAADSAVAPPASGPPSVEPRQAQPAAAGAVGYPVLHVSQEPRPFNETRSVDEIGQAACQSPDGAWHCPNLKRRPALRAFGASPIIPTSWTVPTWFVDPQNTTGVASDANNCSSAATPCLTWHQINDVRWGCLGNPVACPRLQQTTTVTFLSSQSANADIVYVAIATENGATFAVEGQTTTGQVAATGTLNVVTAKNRNTPQLLNVTFNTTTGAFAVGQLLVNATHASRAWVYSAGAGSSFNISQPATANTIPPGLWPPEVNTWTAGDAITAYSLTQVNVASIQVIENKYDASFDNSVSVYQLAIPDSTGFNSNEVTFSNHVNFVESYSDRKLIYQAASGQQWIASVVNNSFVKGGLVGGAQQGVVGGFPFVSSGVVGKAGLDSSRLVGANIDQDVIFVGALDVASANFGTAYVETSTSVNVLSGASFSNAPSGGGTQILWGPGTLNASGTARVVYASGAGQAATAFVNTGGLRSSAQTLGCITKPSSSTITCNTTVSAANADTNLGATSGCLGALNGGAFCNYGP